MCKFQWNRKKHLSKILRLALIECKKVKFELSFAICVTFYDNLFKRTKIHSMNILKSDLLKWAFKNDY
jgi:hypothetical protein